MRAQPKLVITVIDANEEMWHFFRRFALPAGRQ
jgi:hypothetical protein